MKLWIVRLSLAAIHMLALGIVWTGLLNAQSAQSEMELQGLMLKAKDWYFERAVHPQTHMIYGYVDLNDPNLWENTLFPSPESIKNRFCDDSEKPNVSNIPINNGIFLGILTDCYDMTGDPKCFEQARVIFDGLRTCARVSPRKGFIARGVLPVDGKTHLLNSSVDQYTFYVYAFWKYYHSPLAGIREKEDMRQIMDEICAMIEADGTILATNGIPAPVSDIEAIRSDRSSRILEVYRIGYDITGNRHWLEKYKEKLHESDYARIKSLLDPHRVKYPYVPRDEVNDYFARGAIWQTQYSLIPLLYLETDITVRAAYSEAMRLNARLFEERGEVSGGHGLEVVVMALNRYLTAPVTSPFDDDYKEQLRNMVETYVRKNPRSRESQGIFWTALRQGLFAG